MLKIERKQKRIPIKKEPIKIAPIDVKTGRKEKNIITNQNKVNLIINRKIRKSIMKNNREIKNLDQIVYKRYDT